MLMLIVSLVLFLGVHSLRVFADDWRTSLITRVGPNTYRAGFSAVSVVALVGVIWAFGQARLEPVVLWTSPRWLNHVTALLVLVAFVLMTAAYVPGNSLKASMGHPMLAGVKTWALAHLLVNGRLADVILFGAFLVWAVVQFMVCRRRDARLGVARPAVRRGRTVLTVVIGVVAWAVFAGYLHLRLIGVSPMA